MAYNKIGFDYYSVETDRYQDIKIKKLKKNFGCDGLAVYDYILCEIYRVKGSFIEWYESTAFDVSDYFNIKEALVNEIVTYCCAVGLFNRGLLMREKVLTSKAIQKRFTDWSKKAKRINIKIPENVIIITEECDIIQEESSKCSGSLPQSKVKESKVEENTKGDAIASPPSELFLRFEKWITENCPTVCKLKPITQKNVEELERRVGEKEITWDTVKDTLTAMENCNYLLKKYKYGFSTLTRWLKNTATPSPNAPKQPPIDAVAQKIAATLAARPNRNIDEILAERNNADANQ